MLDKNIITAGWLAWLAVILLIIGIDTLRQKERMGYEKLFNLDRSPFIVLAERIGPMVAAWFPPANLDGIEQQITYAGKPWGINSEVFVGIKAVAMGAGLVISSGLAAMGVPSVFTIVIAMLAYFIPDYFLKDRVEKRQKSIRREMPMMLDFLVTSLKSGIELGPALNFIGNRFEGPLGEELRKASREIATGKPRARALKDMAQRTGVEELERFVQTIVMAEERGDVDIATNIEVFARDVRLSRARKAEEESRKLPAKIVGPLILCIFMPMLILILAPVMSILSNAL